MALTYNVYRDGSKVAEGIEETEYTDTGLTPNTSYEYQVSAVNDYGVESALSTAITVTTDYSDVAEVTLTPATLSLQIGDTSELTVTVDPSTAEQGVSYSSDDPEVATVDGNGVVTAIGEGTATITATSDADSSMSDTCTVTVTAPEPEQVQNLQSTGNTDTTADLDWE